MDVCDTAHQDEGKVVEEPADNGVDAAEDDMFDILLGKLGVATLPADEVPCYYQGDDAKGGGAAPVDERVAKQEVFDNRIVPGAHSETDVKDGPLPKVRGEVILFIGVRDQGVVGGHHGDV